MKPKKKTETENIIKMFELEEEFERVKKIARKFKSRVYIYADSEEGYPDNRFFTAEIEGKLYDGYIYRVSRANVDELLRQVEEVFNEQ